MNQHYAMLTRHRIYPACSPLQNTPQSVWEDYIILQNPVTDGDKKYLMKTVVFNTSLERVVLWKWHYIIRGRAQIYKGGPGGGEVNL